MKYFWLGLLIVCLLLAGCLLSEREIARRTEAVAAPLDTALAALREGDAAAGRALLRRSAAEWARHEGTLASLLSHSRTAEIGAAFEELDGLPDAELTRLALRLRRAVRELAGMERPLWRNIF